MKTVLLTIFVCISLTSCSQGLNSLRNLRVGSCKLTGIQPYGFTAVKAELSVGIRNNSKALEVTNIQGVVKIDGKEFVTVNCEKIYIAPKCDSIYSIPVIGRIGSGFNPLTAFDLFYSKDFDRSRVDLSAYVGEPEVPGAKVEVKDVPVTRFLKLK